MMTVETNVNGRLVSKTFTTDAEVITELMAKLKEAYAENDRLRAALKENR